MSILSTDRLAVPHLANAPRLNSVSIRDVSEISDHFGHLSPQEVIGNFVLRSECKIILADLQIASLIALCTRSERDKVEMMAWEECRAIAMLQTPDSPDSYI